MMYVPPNTIGINLFIFIYTTYIHKSKGGKFRKCGLHEATELVKGERGFDPYKDRFHFPVIFGTYLEPNFGLHF